MYLLLSPADITYLTGVALHEVGEVLLLVNNNTTGILKHEGVILCDPRTSGLFDSEKFTVIDSRKGWGEVLASYKTLTTDPDYLTETLRRKIEKYGVTLRFKASPVTKQRSIKTSQELEVLQKSQSINKQVYQKILPFLLSGVTEREIARRILMLQLELGSDGPSFPPIVAFGENSAIPHHSPTNRILQDGDIVLIDMGVIYQGYCSDMTRCIVPDYSKSQR